MKKLLGNMHFQMAVFGLMLALGVSFGLIEPASASLVGFVGAVVTVKSGVVTNRDSVPSVISSRTMVGGLKQHTRGVVNVTNGDNIGSKYIIGSIPSNALVESCRNSNPAIAGATMDVGLYRTTADGGAVVSQQFFKAAVAISGALAKNELVFGNIITIPNSEKQIWQHLGLSADPRIQYDIVGTLAAAATASGAVLIEADYLV